jgi:hypothetical protein
MTVQSEHMVERWRFLSPMFQCKQFTHKITVKVLRTQIRHSIAILMSKFNAKADFGVQAKLDDDQRAKVKLLKQ